jgi:hypothetical protein
MSLATTYLVQSRLQPLNDGATINRGQVEGFWMYFVKNILKLQQNIWAGEGRGGGTVELEGESGFPVK